MDKHRVFRMPFAGVYPHYVQKAEKKGRKKEAVVAGALSLLALTPMLSSAPQKPDQHLKEQGQTFLDAFSSEDLVHWTKHARVLDANDITWAVFAIWAPSVIQANGRYYLFFAANDIQSDQEEGGIGVAVADRPEGPFKDALGKPLVGRFHHGAQPIDPFVFRDDDGQHYLYYGGWRRCNVARLSSDLKSLEPFPDGEVFKNITPANYVEGPFVFRRGGKYYLMWSEGGWGGPNCSVAYAIADSPLGPFVRVGKILQMRFNPDGSIRPVRITFEGVKATRLPVPRQGSAQ